MIEPYPATPEIDVLPNVLDIPGYGTITVNGFVLKAQDPMLIDTGTTLQSDEFVEALEQVIDPEDLRWVWITHTDADHIGSLHRLLDRLPRLRVVTTYTGLSKMSTFAPLPVHRTYLLNPGQQLDLGDRTIVAHKPPLFDAPETTGFLDEKSGALFTADCFGAVLRNPAQDANSIDADELREALLLWASIDTPWIHKVDRELFEAELKAVDDLNPSIVLGAHLPAALGMVSELVNALVGAPEGDPFVGHDQAGLSAMLAHMTDRHDDT